MNNKNEVNKFVLEGLCLKCFYLNFREDGDTFICSKYNFILNGVVGDCPEFLAISEGLNQLIEKIKERGELPEWVEKQTKWEELT